MSIKLHLNCSLQYNVNNVKVERKEKVKRLIEEVNDGLLFILMVKMHFKPNIKFYS